jgi:hypothetical protein
METQLQLVNHHNTHPVETPELRASQRASGTAEANSGAVGTTPGTSVTDAPTSRSDGADTRPDWRIDDASKARGRAGIALARAALTQARLGRPITSDQRVDHTAAA